MLVWTSIRWWLSTQKAFCLHNLGACCGCLELLTALFPVLCTSSCPEHIWLALLATCLASAERPRLTWLSGGSWPTWCYCPSLEKGHLLPQLSNDAQRESLVCLYLPRIANKSLTEMQSRCWSKHRRTYLISLDPFPSWELQSQETLSTFQSRRHLKNTTFFWTFFSVPHSS